MIDLIFNYLSPPSFPPTPAFALSPKITGAFLSCPALADLHFLFINIDRAMLIWTFFTGMMPQYHICKG